MVCAPFPLCPVNSRTSSLGPQRSSVNALTSIAEKAPAGLAEPGLGRARPSERRELTACQECVCTHPGYSWDPLSPASAGCAYSKMFFQTLNTPDSSQNKNTTRVITYKLNLFFLSQAEACPHFNAFTAFIKRSENSVYLIYN